MDDLEAASSEEGIAGRIEIRSEDNKNATFAACIPLFPADEGKGIIRIDEQTRRNIGDIKVGQKVSIRKVRHFIAKEVTIALLDSTSQLDEGYLPDELESFTIRVGDVLSLYYYGTEIGFKVTNIIPEPALAVGEAALIGRNTRFKIEKPT
jgi:transitional endoplasmic reticulum ATPase